MVGLLSISALPRRLALDFRDVFNRGLVFDEINADFVVLDGNAYTDNLKLTGPVAEIGVIGRTGLRDRDYRQQAVVTAEPGKVLPTVGGLLGGPAVAAALLIFTRIFKEPLKRHRARVILRKRQLAGADGRALVTGADRRRPSLRGVAAERRARHARRGCCALTRPH